MWRASAYNKAPRLPYASGTGCPGLLCQPAGVRRADVGGGGGRVRVSIGVAGVARFRLQESRWRDACTLALRVGLALPAGPCADMTESSAILVSIAI